ncbi:hypothetical protein QL285_071614 [Trifolium repens]|nr:hypothetical protein QL285_071614 [Trifolium repens]
MDGAYFGWTACYELFTIEDLFSHEPCVYLQSSGRWTSGPISTSWRYFLSPRTYESMNCEQLSTKLQVTWDVASMRPTYGQNEGPILDVWFLNIESGCVTEVLC